MAKVGNKVPATGYEIRIEELSEGLLGLVKNLRAEVEERSEFIYSLYGHTSRIDLGYKPQRDWLGEQLFRLSKWDRKILTVLNEIIERMAEINTLIGELKKFYKYWPFAITIGNDAELIISGSRFKGDLKSALEYFEEQYRIDSRAWELVRQWETTKEKPKTIKFLTTTSWMHHEAPYSFMPHAISVIAGPRHRFRLNVIESVVNKKVKHMKKILAKEKHYKEAKKFYDKKTHSFVGA